MIEILGKLKNNQNLDFNESKSAFEKIMTGEVSENQIYDFLTLLSKKGETSDEIAGGVFVLREKANNVEVTENTIDTCGTGGDGRCGRGRYPHTLIADFGRIPHERR